jgi:hypothetical protein
MPPAKPIPPVKPTASTMTKPPGRIRNAWNSTMMSVGSSNAPVNIPKPLPKMLGSRPIIFYSWMVALILVGYDEWHTLGVIPRPSRFWYTSLLYGLLVIISIPDAMVPLANALAIGYTFYLIWQYFNGGGQFTNPPSKTAPSTTTGTTGTTSG